MLCFFHAIASSFCFCSGGNISKKNLSIFNLFPRFKICVVLKQSISTVYSHLHIFSCVVLFLVICWLISLDSERIFGPVFWSIWSRVAHIDWNIVLLYVLDNAPKSETTKASAYASFFFVVWFVIFVFYKFQFYIHTQIHTHKTCTTASASAATTSTTILVKFIDWSADKKFYSILEALLANKLSKTQLGPS